MAVLRKYKITFIGFIFGAVLGYAYWNYIGCMSGSCSITSSPINSTIYGSFMGAIFANIFQKDEKK